MEASLDKPVLLWLLCKIFSSKRESSAQGLGGVSKQAEEWKSLQKTSPKKTFCHGIRICHGITMPCFKSRSKSETKKYNFIQAMNKCLCSNVLEIDIIIKAKYSSTNVLPPQIVTHCRCQNCGQRAVAAVAQAGQAQPQLPWAG